MSKGKYIYAIGRRKETTAVLKLFSNGEGSFVVKKQGSDNEVSLKDFFGGVKYLYDNALASLKIINNDFINKYDAEIIVHGGGKAGISDAIRLAFARALILEDAGRRPELKSFGLLKRDPRIKERKKPGLKKARKRPTWSKR